jgi:hypothetical protein
MERMDDPNFAPHATTNCCIWKSILFNCDEFLLTAVILFPRKFQVEWRWYPVDGIQSLTMHQSFPKIWTTTWREQLTRYFHTTMRKLNKQANQQWWCGYFALGETSVMNIPHLQLVILVWNMLYSRYEKFLNFAFTILDQSWLSVFFLDVILAQWTMEIILSKD